MTVYGNPGAIADVVGTTGRIEASWGNAIRDRVVNTFASTAARDAAIPSPSGGMLCFVTADNCYYSRTMAGTWEVFGFIGVGAGTWTPTVTQLGAVSVTVTNASYQKIGRFVTAIVNLVVTGSGTGGNNITVSLPVTAAAAGAGTGAGWIYDSSANQLWSGTVDLGTTDIGLYPSDVNGSAGVKLGAVSMTAGLASNDIIRVHWSYLAAA